MAGGVARRDVPRDPPVLTAPQAARHLRRWGFDAAGLDTCQQRELSHGEHRLRVTAVPARHGPVGFHRLLPPVMGTVLDLLSAFVVQMRRRGLAQRLRIATPGDTVPLVRAVGDGLKG